MLPPKAPRNGPRRRLAPAERAEQILQGAIEFFAERGFAGQTRELTDRLGISKGLLYRYFPTKDALLEEIYAELFVRRWRPEWAQIIADRSRPLDERLAAFYLDFATLLHDQAFVRIYLFSGLAGATMHERFGNRVAERVFKPVVNELRHAFGFPGIRDVPITEPESELMWSLHGGIFYIGMRKWVYRIAVPRDVDGAVRRMVDGLLVNAPEVMKRTLPR